MGKRLFSGKTTKETIAVQVEGIMPLSCYKQQEEQGVAGTGI
jgi:hypothetical protein